VIERMRFLKKHAAVIALTAILLVGVGLLAYPTFSDWYNQFHQTRAINSYQESVDSLDSADYDKMLEEAHAYNERLSESKPLVNKLDDEQAAEYDSQLDVTGTGIMAYVEIPKIDCKLPIYHGTDEEVLQVAVGHIPGSSLPVGGESTHAVISSHRGLPSARLFTDLDQLVEGDVFVIHVLNEDLAYEVDQINIVLPSDLSLLGIQDGKDLCTLVTCTPYGVNTHRLLIRGHRVPYEDVALVPADATQIDAIVVAPFIAAILLVVLFLWLLLATRRPRGKMSTEEATNRLREIDSAKLPRTGKHGRR
jgi:sortase A